MEDAAPQKSGRREVGPPASPAADMDAARAATRLRVLLSHLGCPPAKDVVSLSLRGARVGRVVASLEIAQPLSRFFPFLGAPAPVLATALLGAGR